MIRLDKYLADMGVGTRQEVKKHIRQGRASVDGMTVKRADLKVDESSQTVTFDGEEIPYAAFEYYMLNKPQGVVSATEDGRYPTAVELIGSAVRKDLFPAGRLDVDTEGLLLITNDGELAPRLLSPKRHVDKTYYAHILGSLPADSQKQFEAGIILEDGLKTMPAVLNILSEEEPGKDLTAVTLTIQEGKFHQVKRMFQALGCQVVYLKRLSMGSLVLDGKLKPGEYRRLTEEELAGLKKGESIE